MSTLQLLEIFPALFLANFMVDLICCWVFLIVEWARYLLEAPAEVARGAFQAGWVSPPPSTAVTGCLLHLRSIHLLACVASREGFRMAVNSSLLGHKQDVVKGTLWASPNGVTRYLVALAQAPWSNGSDGSQRPRQKSDYPETTEL